MLFLSKNWHILALEILNNSINQKVFFLNGTENKVEEKEANDNVVLFFIEDIEHYLIKEQKMK